MTATTHHWKSRFVWCNSFSTTLIILMISLLNDSRLLACSAHDNRVYKGTNLKRTQGITTQPLSVLLAIPPLRMMSKFNGLSS
jgi:hypothetical protein